MSRSFARRLRGALGILGLGETRLLDINAAVSEACNNVVVHAYPDADGPMDVRLWIGQTGLEVIVSDNGVGIRPQPTQPQLELQGLGLSLIQTLTEWVEFLGGAGDGTKVRMGFSLDGGPSEPDDEPPHGREATWIRRPGSWSWSQYRLVRSPRRCWDASSRCSAARVGFSLEGVSEAQLVTDSLAAHAPAVTLGDKIQLGIDNPDRRAPGQGWAARRGRRGAGPGLLRPGEPAAGARAADERSPSGELLRAASSSA